MATTPNDLGHGVLALAGTDMATAAAGQKEIITHCTLYNAHTSAVTVTIYYLQSGDSVGGNGTYKDKVNIPPGKKIILYSVYGQTLASAGKLHGVPSVTNVVHYNVSGDVIT